MRPVLYHWAILLWWRVVDLNHWLLAYETSEIPDFSNSQCLELCSNGRRGSRTPKDVTLDGFQDRCRRQSDCPSWRKMLDSNQRRCYPHSLANCCINRSANLPKKKSRCWLRLCKNYGTFLNSALLRNGTNWTRTSALSIISRMLYQLSYGSVWERRDSNPHGRVTAKSSCSPDETIIP